MRLFTLALITFFAMSFAKAQVVITEIMYNPPESGQDVHEFIELYNNGADAVDMTGYSFASGVDYTFEAFTLDPGQYVLLSVNADALLADFGVTSIQWANGSLSNGGETIQLVNAAGDVVIDEVTYDDGGDWSSLADGPGASLVLCDFDADNDDGTNWAAANTATGFVADGKEAYATPGTSVACLSGPIIQFLDTELEVSEDGGTASFRIEISGAELVVASHTIEIIAMASSSASIPADATFMPASMTFDIGTTTDTISVTVNIVDDAEVESPENLILVLSNPSNGLTVLGVNSQANLTIADNDSEIADVVINEIMYNTPGVDDYEFIELYNNGASAVDMAGYYFSEGVEKTFSAGTMIMPGGFLVVAVDSLLYESAYGGAAFQWEDGVLGNGGEVIELRDPLGNVVDMVEYDDGGDWPSEPDGGGQTLILCDPSSDNSLASSWIAATQSFEIFINAAEIFGSPGAVNDCTPAEPEQYEIYPVGTVTTVNAVGVLDSIGVKVELTGVVHGVDLQANGHLFTIIDNANDGVAVFNSGDEFGYTVAEGDEITIRGTVTQYNGLAQIATDTVWMNTAGNALQDVLVVTALDESTESQLVRMDAVVIESAVVAGGGLNVTILDGNSESYTVRVDFDTDMTEEFINGFGGQLLRITGLGGQFDSTGEPFDGGYQLLPRYQTDISVVVGVSEPEWATSVRLFPVPVSNKLSVELAVQATEFSVSNSLGQVISTDQVESTHFEVDASNWPTGVYYLEISSKNERVVRKFVKQ